jgi:hypothetical protein
MKAHFDGASLHGKSGGVNLRSPFAKKIFATAY